jgi:hypothetical protein
MIDSLERGADQNHLTVDVLVDLARALGMQLRDLLVDQPPPTPAVEPDGIDPSDPATVGRHLATAGRVHVDELARTLGWTTGRTRWALHVLEERLADTGQRLAWVADTEAQLAPGPGPTDTTDHISRRNLRAFGLQDNGASLLHAIITRGPLHRYSDLDSVALGRLRAAGLITTDPVYKQGERRNGDRTGEGARLAEGGRFNLCIDG